MSVLDWRCVQSLSDSTSFYKRSSQVCCNETRRCNLCFMTSRCVSNQRRGLRLPWRISTKRTPKQVLRSTSFESIVFFILFFRLRWLACMKLSFSEILSILSGFHNNKQFILNSWKLQVFGFTTPHGNNKNERYFRLFTTPRNWVRKVVKKGSLRSQLLSS